jgi:hypothetical protein
MSESAGLGSEVPQRALRVLAGLLDRLLATVGEEHRREAERLLRSKERDEALRVERLLAGELIDPSGLDYAFEGHHLAAAVAGGAGAVEATRALAETQDCRLLLVERGEGVLWAWIGSRAPIDPERVLGHAGALQSPFPRVRRADSARAAVCPAGRVPRRTGIWRDARLGDRQTGRGLQRRKAPLHHLPRGRCRSCCPHRWQNVLRAGDHRSGILLSDTFKIEFTYQRGSPTTFNCSESGYGTLVSSGHRRT